ncbi:MAG: hypothetical protein A2145_04320 [candidate division Zixibacteria bacterium RBG_16_40_9]|nr:MAG: hypothetical protein A2145_04320 [candidate division Zixibacteria bacterium RBG_16_40_9]
MKLTFKKNLTYLFLVSPLFLLTCQKSPTGPAGIREYYPLAIGNFWLYANSDNTYKVQDEIIGFDHLSDGSSVFVKRKISRYQSAKIADTVTSYLKFVSDELREYPEKDCPLTYIILLKSPLQLGAKWKTGSGGDCSIAPISFTDTVTDLKNITVAAGKFNDCFEIETPLYCTPDPIEPIEICYIWNMRWFAPDVGIVKWAPGGWESQAFTLRQYRVR